MAKRIADSQITRETFNEGSDSDNENGGSSSMNHGVASSSVMSRRKIAMPKRKTAGGFSFQPKPSAESNMSNAFNIFKQAQPSGKETPKDDRNAKLKALNVQFKDKVVEIINADSFADLRPALDKYKQYIEPLTSKAEKAPVAAAPVAAAPPKIAKPVESDKKKDTAPASSSSSEDEEEEIKVEGPKFTLQSKPTTLKSVFSFGPKKEEPKRRSDSDSEDEIEVKGPQFTFTGEVKSDVFKLNKPEQEKKEKAPPANPFQSQKTESAAPEKPAFSFLNKSADAAKPTFNFGQPKAEEEKPSKPTFGFGQPRAEGEQPSKPTFGFSQPKAEGEQPSKPTFGFGQPKTEGEQAKKPSFVFGQPKTDQEQPKKPSFNFNFKSSTAAPAASEKNDSKPSFSFKFGQEKPQEQQDSQAEKPKPSFSFGTPAPAANGDKKTDVKPAFSFGSTNSSAAPSFSFAKPDTTGNKNETDKSNTNNAPSAGFKFSLPFNQKPATQTSSSPSTSIPAPSQSEEPKTEENKEENKEEPSKPIDMQNGEEDENAIFSQRSKLMIFNNETKSYDSRGVGELKLLQNKEDKSKVRLLCRSDGMGNILLNTSLIKSFSYSPLTPESDNLIKLPVVEPEGKLVTYVAKFKQKSDGRLLVKSVEDVKKDM